MKQMQSLNESLFQKLEKDNMKKLVGGKIAEADAALTANPTIICGGPNHGQVVPDNDQDDTVS